MSPFPVLPRAQLLCRAQVSEQAQEAAKGREVGKEKVSSHSWEDADGSRRQTGMKKQALFWGEVALSAPQTLSYQLKQPGYGPTEPAPYHPDWVRTAPRHSSLASHPPQPPSMYIPGPRSLYWTAGN